MKAGVNKKAEEERAAAAATAAALAATMAVETNQEIRRVLPEACWEVLYYIYYIGCSLSLRC